MLTSKELLVYLSIIYDNDFDRIYNHICNKDYLDNVLAGLMNHLEEMTLFLTLIRFINILG